MQQDGQGRGDDVYQPDGSEVQDDEELLDSDDTLTTETDPGERGYSPPERPSPAVRHGVTGEELQHGEGLEDLLAQEEPDDLDAGRNGGDGIGDTEDTDGEPRDHEVGDARAGRLVAYDEGAHEGEEADVFARDVGVDSGAASAEEAAVHVVEDDEEQPRMRRPGTA